MKLTMIRHAQSMGNRTGNDSLLEADSLSEMKSPLLRLCLLPWSALLLSGWFLYAQQEESPGAAAGAWRSEVGTPVAISADLLGPSRRISVASTEGFAVGDWVVLRSDLTGELVADFKMSDLWNRPEYRDRLGGMLFYRQITAIDVENHFLEVDVPTRFALLTRDNARVVQTVELLEEVGLEEFAIGNVQHPGTDGWGERDYTMEGRSAHEVHGSRLILWRGARNSWMQSVHA